MLSKKPLVSVCIPTYNSAHLILDTLKALFTQSYKNIEIIISDDASTDDTVAVIKSFRSKKIKIHRNRKNLGYGRNIKQFKKLIKGDIIYLLAQDDFLINDGLTLTVKEFVTNRRVGVVTRPYYWFADNPSAPVRHIPPPHKDKTTLIDINKNPQDIIPIIESVGQLSGLAYRTDLFTQFHQEVFPAHIYPFMRILRTHLAAFLPTYTIAVGILDSQTRSKSAIYNISPTLSWVKMFRRVFSSPQFKRVKTIAIDYMARNYLGLVQLKNYARTPRILYREIFYLIRFRPRNLLSPQFWFFTLGTIIMPRQLLIPLVDWYKNTINSKIIRIS